MKRFSRTLYLQVITAVVIGALVGHIYPNFGVELKPLGEGFIELVKMLIAPIARAQATNTHVTMVQELEIPAVLLLTSKRAAAVREA